MTTARQFAIAYARSKAAGVIENLELWHHALTEEEEIIADEELRKIARRISMTVNYEHLEEYNQRELKPERNY